jgi:hypothetical protein
MHHCGDAMAVVYLKNLAAQGLGEAAGGYAEETLKRCRMAFLFLLALCTVTVAN